MGGLGSGRSGWRGVLDHCYWLDVNRLHRKGYIGEYGWTTWGWSDEYGERLASIGLSFSPEAMELSYTVSPGTEEAERLRYSVPFTWTPCTYGGERPWFTCPGAYCGRRVGVLYLWGRYFVCRHCTGAAYASQNETREDRLMRRARKIWRRLEERAKRAGEVSGKPKGMHWRTFERLLAEAEWADYSSLRLAVRRVRGGLR